MPPTLGAEGPRLAAWCATGALAPALMRTSGALQALRLAAAAAVPCPPVAACGAQQLVSLRAFSAAADSGCSRRSSRPTAEGPAGPAAAPQQQPAAAAHAVGGAGPRPGLPPGSAAQQLASARSFRSSSAGLIAWGGVWDPKRFINGSSHPQALGVVVSAACMAAAAAAAGPVCCPTA